MEKIKFVMTDTDPQVSALCSHALEDKGVAVTVCEKNGTKALETLLATHPQAVLLDAFMPDLDAITVKQRYEAQNTSIEQMKMFLTRLGFGSTAVITGDMTQIDLPKHQKSGLKDAVEVLRGVDGVHFTFFESRDVVRHPLVARIVNAYEARDANDAQPGSA